MDTNSKEQIPFGLHLLLDLYDCSPETLNKENLVHEILNALPDKLGMKKLMDPYVLLARANDKRDPGGWSGFVMIQESHISIHTFIKRRFVTVDVYSCKQFDTEEVILYFKNVFGTENVEQHVVNRGTHYPAENID